jgi:anti-sigma B factor antagonist
VERLEIKVMSSDSDRHVVALRGELDLAAADRAWTELEPLITPGTFVVLDGTELEFLDSSGLRVLALAAHRARDVKAGLRLVAPHHAVQRALALAGAEKLIETRPSLEEALAG